MIKARTVIGVLGALLLLPGVILAFIRYSAHKAAATPPDSIVFQEGILYGKGGSQDLNLDLAHPKSAQGKLPALVMIHGGGWTGGHRRDFRPLQFRLASAGVVCATVQYRLAPQDKFPAQIEDVKCAVRWLRAHAGDYGIDPDRIAAIGASAGAHLAVLLALTGDQPQLEGSGGNPETSSQVIAAVGLAGPYDLSLAYANSPRQRKQEGDTVRSLLEGFLGGNPAQVPEQYAAASPITYARREVAPVFLCHGEMDPLVPVEQAEVFARKLREVGAEVEYLKIPDGTHDSFGKDQEKHLLRMLSFLKRQLQMP